MKLEIPPKGLPKEDVLKMLREMRDHDVDYNAGKVWSLVYPFHPEHLDFVKTAYNEYFSENALNPMAFKSLKKMEHEVVRMTADLFHGGDFAVGTMSSGGTESLLLVVKTYRDLWRSKNETFWNKIKGSASQFPEMILPESAHIAFNKASYYFDVKIVYAPLDENKRVNVAEVEKRINKNTILIVGSAPSYPFGTIDPIEELGALALKYKLPLHVDACVGGFILPFIEKNNRKLPLWDFRVPGVTSISADIHKYGFAAKGASILLYRNMEYLRHQFFVNSEWTGGMFVSPALLGTRPGGAIAAAWATLMYMGQNSYIETAERIMQTTDKLTQGIKSIEGLALLGTPHASLFAYHSVSPQIDIYAVGDQMEKKGWHIDRQPKPPCLHAMVSPIHETTMGQYLEDLREAVEYVKNHQELKNEGNAAMYGMMAKLPMRGMIENELLNLMEQMYSVEGQTPALESDRKDFKTQMASLLIKIKDKVDGWMK